MTTRDAIEGQISADASGFNLVAFVGRTTKWQRREAVRHEYGGSYFGNMKNFLIDIYAELRVVCEKKVATMAVTLANHCANREGSFMRRTAPCEKRDSKH
ncbi:hypothetical protein PybrP1_005305 [[Pythium] brassicae (nom. inval.)]|nr:hypothetical protein PybrP1_005305 [[Pythium] brassicae (nom. inval.)]